MNQLTKFADLLFQELPEDAEREQAKEIIYKRLNASYEEAMQEGMSSKDAFLLTMTCFGALEGAVAEYRHQKLLSAYCRFRKKYPIMIRCGLIALILVPLIFLILFSSVESKLVALTGWIISLIGLITFVICVEYVDYHYKKLLEQRRPMDSEPDEIEKELAMSQSFLAFRETNEKVPHNLPPSKTHLPKDNVPATVNRDIYSVTQAGGKA